MESGWRSGRGSACNVWSRVGSYDAMQRGDPHFFGRVPRRATGGARPSSSTPHRFRSDVYSTAVPFTSASCDVHGRFLSAPRVDEQAAVTAEARRGRRTGGVRRRVVSPLSLGQEKIRAHSSVTELVVITGWNDLHPIHQWITVPEAFYLIYFIYLWRKRHIERDMLDYPYIEILFNRVNRFFFPAYNWFLLALFSHGGFFFP